MKRIPLNIQKEWCKIYIQTENKIEVRDNFIKAFPLRYSFFKANYAHQTLKMWVKKYNLGIMGIKKLGRPSKMREIDKVYHRKGKLEDLTPHDHRIYTEILEQIITNHKISKAEILEEIRKRKEEIDQKKNTCGVIGVTRQKVYEMPKKRQYRHNEEWLKMLVLKVFLESHRVYGYIKIFGILQHFPNVTLWKVRKTYEELQLITRKTISQSKHCPKEDKTTNISTQNIINRNFISTSPNQKWFIDSSCIKLHNKKHLWLCAIVDTFSSNIVSWKLSHTNDTNLAVSTLNLAIDKFGAPKVIHSDHGSNFLSQKFKNILKAHNITQSVSRVANSLDNRPIEYFFGLLKHEWLYHMKLTSLSKASEAINNYINWYNNDRIQIKLNNMSPNQYLTKFNYLKIKFVT